MQGYGCISQALSRYAVVNFGQRRRRREPYNFENVGNDLVGRNMTIILEQISLYFAYVVEGRLVPSCGLVSSAMFEAMGNGRSVVDYCRGHGESFTRE